MKLEIMGTERLGVRGLSCVVEDHGVIILVDPGITLGYNRWGLHPSEVNLLKYVQPYSREGEH